MFMKLDTIIAERAGKTVYRDGDKSIKLFDSTYSKSDILNEALNQARIEETGLNIPKLIEVTMIEDKWAIVSEFIEGKTLAQLMTENPDKYNEYLETFVGLQMEIHTKKSPLLTKLRDKMNRKISDSSFDATTRYELHTRLESTPRHTKVLHGDFNASNIIVGKDGKLYVIDWAHATQGNASADAARTYLLFCLAGETEKGDKYLDLFCKKSNIARQYIQKWLPIVAASQSVKSKAEEAEFLANWVDVFDYQ